MMCASLHRPYEPNKSDFLNFTPEKIFELIDSLQDEDLCSALSVLLSRADDTEWLFKTLRKVMTRCLRIQDKVRSSDIYFILKQQILRFVQNQQGECLTHGLIFLAADAKWTLPDELVNFLIINSEINHWVPLLTESQRMHCLKELLKNADTQKKYLNLLLFLSPDKLSAEREVKMIMEDMLNKYPHFLLADFTPEHHHCKNHLMILTVIPALLFCLDKTRHSELLYLLLAQLKKNNARAREAILNILFECFPYLEDSRLFIFKAVRPYLDDGSSRVRLAAQRVLSCFSTQKDGELLNKPEIDLYQRDVKQFQKLSSVTRNKKIKVILLTLTADMLLDEEAGDFLLAALPYMSYEENSLLINTLLLQVKNKNVKIRKAAAKFLAKCIHYVSVRFTHSIIHGILSLVKDENWFIRASFWEILNAAIPHLKKDTLALVFQHIIPYLSDINWIIQDQVLKALPQLFPHMSNELSHLALTAILPYLDESDWSQRYAGLQTLNLFIKYAPVVQPSIILEVLISKLQDKNSIVSGMAMQALIPLLSKVESFEHKRILAVLLHRLNDPNSYVAQLSRKVLLVLMPQLNRELRCEVIGLFFNRLSQEKSPQLPNLRDLNLYAPYLDRIWGVKVYHYLLPILNQKNRELVVSALEILNLCVKYLEPQECKELSYLLFPKLIEENCQICDEALKVILHCGIYLNEEERQFLNIKLESYIKQHSISLWCANLEQNDTNVIF
ncbi:MAG: hypothetical protein BGO90_15095 [Legionella sp. 40-6]|nr:hypothetical protein [Legionella sp.]OJY37137.1 MAG: hypothetical protein BGO90_15095 [Legionella sp. 40-6]